MSDNSAALNCFLCGENASDLKKLKFHLLLKHSNSNICLFCIEKKGWSSEFPRNAFNSFQFVEWEMQFLSFHVIWFEGKFQSGVIQWTLSGWPLWTDPEKGWAKNCWEKQSFRFVLIISKQSWELFHLNSCIVEAKKAVREKMKEIAQKKRDEVSQVKRMKNPRACPHCPGFPIFETGAQKDNHLISSHNYDYCKICKVNLNLSLFSRERIFTFKIIL